MFRRLKKFEDSSAFLIVTLQSLFGSGVGDRRIDGGGDCGHSDGVDGGDGGGSGGGSGGEVGDRDAAGTGDGRDGVSVDKVVGGEGGGGGGGGEGEALGSDGASGGFSSIVFFLRRVGGRGCTTGATPVSFARLRVNMPMKVRK